MDWLTGSELVGGCVVLGLALLLTWALRKRKMDKPPSALGLALVPISVLLVFVLGFVLIAHGIGLI